MFLSCTMDRQAAGAVVLYVPSIRTKMNGEEWRFRASSTIIFSTITYKHIHRLSDSPLLLLTD